MVRAGKEIIAPESPEIAGYKFVEWIPSVLETMPAQDVEYIAVFEAEDYAANFVADGKIVSTVPYTVETQAITEPLVPVKTGYTGVWQEYELLIGGVTVNAVYTPIDYSISFVADGKTVSTVTYNIMTESIVEPVVPEKSGYIGKWDSYELLTGNITVNAVYAAANYTVTFMVDGKVHSQESYVFGETILLPINPTKTGYSFVGWTPGIPTTMPAENLQFTAVFESLPQISIQTPSVSEINYGDTLILHANISDIPEDAKIVWEASDSSVILKPSADGKSCEVTSDSSGNVKVTAKVVDASGNPIKDDNGNNIEVSQKVTSNASFWQKIVSFFKNLFGINRTITQAFGFLF